MIDIKRYSVMYCPVKRRVIENWHLAAGIAVEHHHSTTGFLNSTVSCENAIVFCEWNSRHFSRSSQMLTLVKSQLSSTSYLVALSHRDTEKDIEEALYLGADRFIRSDVSARIFNALVDSVIRRIDPFLVVRHFPPYSINQMTREVHVAHEKIQLTPQEFRIAHYFFEHQDCLLSRTTLLRDVWCLPDLDYRRRVDAKISHIRHKMKLDGTYGWSLTNRNGKGYQLSSDRSMA